MKPWIKLSLPTLSGNEKKYVSEAVDSTWIVPLGPYVDLFEQRIAKFFSDGNSRHDGDVKTVVASGRPFVVAVSAGTAAIHLALDMCGVRPGDEVICQSLTFAASANPIKYLGATPVFVDSERETMNMDPDLLAEAIEDRRRVTGRYPRAIVAVDLYGMPAQWDRVCAVASRYGIPVVEDAAEALGSMFGGAHCGTFGQYGTLSFNGNKIMTTSGGGAVICHYAKRAERVEFLATQAREKCPYYYHKVIGYNYRLSNVSAAIGCAQIETLDERVRHRRDLHRHYLRGLASLDCVQVQDNPSPTYDSNFWLTTIQLLHHDPEKVRLHMLDNRIETRRLWRPMHMQPVFADAPHYGGDVSAELFEHGLCLPSGGNLTHSDVDRVIATLREVLK